MRRRFALVLLALLLPLAACTLPNATTLTSDAADPDIAWDGANYVLHTTNTLYGNVPTWTSTDLGGWTFAGDALPHLPSWAESGWTWAPSVIRRDDGTWFLYFSAGVRGRKTANGEPLKCIGVASARSASGPFTVVPELDRAPLLCDSPIGGDIDPSAFRQDSSGATYLVTKVDGNSMGRPTRLENRRLNPNLWSFAPFPPTVLLTNASGTWEGGVVEGPDLVLTAGNRLHLLYSGGFYGSATYGEGQALCAATNTACVRNGRLLNAPSYGSGAGGASAFRTRSGGLVLAWHAYTTANSTTRSLLLGTVAAAPNGVLSVGGSPVPSAAPAAEQRTAGVLAPVSAVRLTVPAGQPVTVPNAHSR